MRKGNTTYRGKYKITHVVVHPKYDGSPYCGFDFAICFISKSIEGKYNEEDYSMKYPVTDKFAYCLEENEMTTEVMKGKMLSIVGYPGEKEGFLYEHSGPIVSIHKTRLGGYNIAYDIDTTPGNSGSSIMLLDQKMVGNARNIVLKDNYFKY